MYCNRVDPCLLSGSPSNLLSVFGARSGVMEVTPFPASMPKIVIGVTLSGSSSLTVKRVRSRAGTRSGVIEVTPIPYIYAKKRYRGDPQFPTPTPKRVIEGNPIPTSTPKR